MNPQPRSGIVATGTILDRIIARKIEEVEALGPITPNRAIPLRDFASAMRRPDGNVALIAEIKHASPSKGILIDPFDPAGLARLYGQGGASALSVLTDHDFFKGDLADLQTARAQVDIPALRKDFTIDPKQIVEAYNAVADAILLIVAALDDARLRDLHAAAAALGLAALVEVHTEAEMERALRINAPLIGINNRDLHTFHVDLAVFERVARLIPRNTPVTLVAESGIFSPVDVERVAAAGASAILVGESIVKAPDVVAQVRALAGVPRAPR